MQTQGISTLWWEAGTASLEEWGKSVEESVNKAICHIPKLWLAAQGSNQTLPALSSS